jgi:hypothetical protein
VPPAPRRLTQAPLQRFAFFVNPFPICKTRSRCLAKFSWTRRLSLLCRGHCLQILFSCCASRFAFRPGPFALRAGPFAFRAGPFALRAGPFALRAGLFALRAGLFALRAGLFALRAGLFAFRAGPFALRAGLFAFRRNLRGVRRNSNNSKGLLRKRAPSRRDQSQEACQRNRQQDTLHAPRGGVPFVW